MRIESTTRRFYSHTFRLCATTGFHFFLKIYQNNLHKRKTNWSAMNQSYSQFYCVVTNKHTLTLTFAEDNKKPPSHYELETIPWIIQRWHVKRSEILKKPFVLSWGQSWRSGTKCDCKTDWLWIRSLLEEMKYLLKFIFSFLRSSVEAKRGVEFCHSTRNVSRIRQKVGNGVY